MADLVLHNLLTLAGSAPSYIDSNAGGDRALNLNSRTRIWIDNLGADVDCTIYSKRESDFGPYPDFVVTIPAGSFYVLPPFSALRFNQTDGKLHFEFDSPGSSVRIAAVEDESVLKGTS